MRRNTPGASGSRRDARESVASSNSPSQSLSSFTPASSTKRRQVGVTAASPLLLPVRGFTTLTANAPSSRAAGKGSRRNSRSLSSSVRRSLCQPRGLSAVTPASCATLRSTGRQASFGSRNPMPCPFPPTSPAEPVSGMQVRPGDLVVLEYFSLVDQEWNWCLATALGEPCSGIVPVELWVRGNARTSRRLSSVSSVSSTTTNNSPPQLSHSPQELHINLPTSPLDTEPFDPGFLSASSSASSFHKDKECEGENKPLRKLRRQSLMGLHKCTTEHTMTIDPALSMELLPVGAERISTLRGTSVPLLTSPTLTSHRDKIERKQLEVLERLRGIYRVVKDMSEQQRDQEKNQREAEEQFTRAQAELHSAREDVQQIDPQHLYEIQSYRVPPDAVQFVMSVVMLVLGEEANTWQAIASVMRRPNFIATVVSFEPSQLTEAHKEIVSWRLAQQSRFSYRDAVKGSKPIGHMYNWVIKQIEFSAAENHLKSFREQDEKFVEKFQVLQLQWTQDVAQVRDLITELKQLGEKYRSEYETLTGRSGGQEERKDAHMMSSAQPRHWYRRQDGVGFVGVIHSGDVMCVLPSPPHSPDSYVLSELDQDMVTQALMENSTHFTALCCNWSTSSVSAKKVSSTPREDAGDVLQTPKSCTREIKVAAEGDSETDTALNETPQRHTADCYDEKHSVALQARELSPLPALPVDPGENGAELYPGASGYISLPRSNVEQEIAAHYEHLLGVSREAEEKKAVQLDAAHAVAAGLKLEGEKLREVAQRHILMHSCSEAQADNLLAAYQAMKQRCEELEVCGHSLHAQLDETHSRHKGCEAEGPPGSQWCSRNNHKGFWESQLHSGSVPASEYEMLPEQYAELQRKYEELQAQADNTAEAAAEKESFEATEQKLREQYAELQRKYEELEKRYGKVVEEYESEMERLKRLLRETQLDERLHCEAVAQSEVTRLQMRCSELERAYQMTSEELVELRNEQHITLQDLDGAEYKREVSFSLLEEQHDAQVRSLIEQTREQESTIVALQQELCSERIRIKEETLAPPPGQETLASETFRASGTRVSVSDAQQQPLTQLRVKVEDEDDDCTDRGRQSATSGRCISDWLGHETSSAVAAQSLAANVPRLLIERETNDPNELSECTENTNGVCETTQHFYQFYCRSYDDHQRKVEPLTQLIREMEHRPSRTSSTTAIEEQAQELTALREKNAELVKRTQELEEQSLEVAALKQENAALANRSHDLEAVGSRLSELQQENSVLAQRTREAEERSARLLELQRENEALRDRTREISTQMMALEALKTENTILLERTSELDALRTQLNVLKEENVTVSNLAREVEDAMTQQHLNPLSKQEASQLIRLQEENETLLRSIRALEAALATEQGVVTVLQEENKSRLAALQTKYEKEQLRGEELQHQLATLRTVSKDNERLSKENAQMKERLEEIEVLTFETETLTAENKRLTDTLTEFLALQNENKTLENRNRLLEHESNHITAIITENTALTQRVLDLEDDLRIMDIVKKDNIQLTERVTELEQQNEQLNHHAQDTKTLIAAQTAMQQQYHVLQHQALELQRDAVNNKTLAQENQANRQRPADLQQQLDTAVTINKTLEQEARTQESQGAELVALRHEKEDLAERVRSLEQEARTQESQGAELAALRHEKEDLAERVRSLEQEARTQESQGAELAALRHEKEVLLRDGRGYVFRCGERALRCGGSVRCLKCREISDMVYRMFAVGAVLAGVVDVGSEADVNDRGSCAVGSELHYCVEHASQKRLLLEGMNSWTWEADARHIIATLCILLGELECEKDGCVLSNILDSPGGDPMDGHSERVCPDVFVARHSKDDNPAEKVPRADRDEEALALVPCPSVRSHPSSQTNVTEEVGENKTIVLELVPSAVVEEAQQSSNELWEIDRQSEDETTISGNTPQVYVPDEVIEAIEYSIKLHQHALFLCRKPQLLYSEEEVDWNTVMLPPMVLDQWTGLLPHLPTTCSLATPTCSLGSPTSPTSIVLPTPQAENDVSAATGRKSCERPCEEASQRMTDDVALLLDEARAATPERQQSHVEEPEGDTSEYTEDYTEEATITSTSAYASQREEEALELQCLRESVRYVIALSESALSPLALPATPPPPLCLTDTPEKNKAELAGSKAERHSPTPASIEVRPSHSFSHAETLEEEKFTAQHQVLIQALRLALGHLFRTLRQRQRECTAATKALEALQKRVEDAATEADLVRAMRAQLPERVTDWPAPLQATELLHLALRHEWSVTLKTCISEQRQRVREVQEALEDLEAAFFVSGRTPSPPLSPESSVLQRVFAMALHQAEESDRQSRDQEAVQQQSSKYLWTSAAVVGMGLLSAVRYKASGGA